MAKASEVDIVNVRIGANITDTAANVSTVAIVDTRVGNNTVIVKNGLEIDVAGNCLKWTGEITTWEFLRLGGIEAEKADSLAAMGITTLVCKG